MERYRIERRIPWLEASRIPAHEKEGIILKQFLKGCGALFKMGVRKFSYTVEYVDSRKELTGSESELFRDCYWSLYEDRVDAILIEFRYGEEDRSGAETHNEAKAAYNDGLQDGGVHSPADS